jgi:hypothetical protein
MGFAQQVADTPYTPYTGATVAQLNPYQTGALDAMAARAYQGSPVSDAASSELTKTLQGGYLGDNPYLSGQIDLASRDVMRNMDALNARSGSFGNSGIQQATARGIGDIATTMRGNAYNAERGRMMAGVGMAPQIANQDYTDAQQLLNAGQAYQGQEQANLGDTYRRFTEARDYPQQQLATMGKGLGINLGSSTTGPGANPWAQAIGTGLALYGGYRGGAGGGK